MTNTDYIEELGALVLDHRLKRLMNRLLAGAEEIYAARGLDFRARWTSTFLLLRERSPRTVTELADLLRLTHPAMIQVTRGMLEAGWIVEQRDPEDGRRRLLSLSDPGHAVGAELDRVWSAMGGVQQELFAALGVDILDVLGEVETALDEVSLAERVLELLPAPEKNEE